MSKLQDKKNIQDVSSPQRVERELPLDTQLLSEAVIELNISRKNVGTYPPGHIQITKSIERAYDILLRLFELRSEMTLGVAKDTLMVGRDYLDQKNPVYRDFAFSMSKQEIAAVTFISGLAKEELVRFHCILATKPEDIRAAGGIGKVMAEADIPHIRIHAIDYSSFHATEEQEIFKSQEKRMVGEKAGGGLWQDFITHLSAGTLAGPEGGVSVKDAVQIDPAELARLLNERKLDQGAALQSYDRIVSHHMLERAEKRELTHEQSTTLTNMSKMIQDLHPELRKQFLSVAFRRISSQVKPVVAEEIVGGFSDNLVIEMLKQASEEGREISPTLMGLVGRLTKAQAQDTMTGDPHHVGKEIPTEGTEMPPLMTEHMEELFSREKYEEYVSEDYDAMLKRLSDASANAGEQFPVEEYAKTFEEDHLDFQIGSALLAFLEEDIDEEDYEEFARKLIAIMPGFLKTGNFELLRDMYETLRKHTTEKQVKGIRDIAEETHKAFSEPQFISEALSAFEVWMWDKEQAAAGLIQALGPVTVPGLLDMLQVSEDKDERVRIIQVIVAIGTPSIPAILSQIASNGPWFVLRNLSYILGRLGGEAETNNLIPLLLHENQKVQTEALKSLQRIGGKLRAERLLSVLPMADDQLKLKIVEMLGIIKATEAVPALVELIKSKDRAASSQKADLDVKICTALGKICSKEALPVLTEVTKLKGLFTSRIYPKKVRIAASKAIAAIDRDSL
ncbi:MAG: PBS heat-like protein repeat-containing protein [uncultured bacterium]|nr:MAG: PBS heat-like protein repeat-containing protein [uncultured bacterium]